MSRLHSKASAQAVKGFGIVIAGLISGSALAAFPASVNLSGLNGSNGTRIDGVLSGDFLGYSISKTGDFNADGREDFIIGAPNSATLPGAAYVIYGTDSGLPFPVNLSTLSANNNGFRIDGAADNSQLGTAVADAGDVNGDGLADLIVGAPGESAAYVLFGKAGGYPGDIVVSSLNGSNGFRIGGISNGQLGYSVANAGDVNGDHINDIIIGNGAPNVGAGYVLFGSSSSGFPAGIDASTLTGSKGFAIVGAAANTAYFIVSAANDINADGVDDMIVGSWNSAAAYIVFGQPAGFAAPVDLTALNGSNGFVLNDGTAGSLFGSAVAGIGDINGDDIADVAIGAPMASTNSSNNQAGKTYVVFGSGAGFTSPFNAAGLNGVNGGFQIYGAASRDRSGWSVAAAGDINGDGHADLSIGAPYSSYNGSASGTSYVIFGKTGAFTSPFNLTGNTAFINHLDGNNGFQLPGVNVGEQSGWAVAGGGDLNGDGAGDLLIGARLASTFDGTVSLTNSGTGYVFYGQGSDNTSPITTINNTPQANAFGWNNSAVTFSVTAQDTAGGSGVKETRCALNPASVPASVNDLTVAGCANAGINSGGYHVFYAASIDNAGNQETPVVSRRINIDLTPPVVTVTGVKNGAIYRRDKVPKAGCSTSDKLSGVVANAVLTISGGNSSGTGNFTATCSGALDQAGNVGTAAITYTVR